MGRECPPGEAGPKCTEHPGFPAVARCVGCGRLLCATCRVLYGNRNYCRPCASSSDASGFTAPSPPPFPAPPPYPFGMPTVTRRPRREPVFPGAPWGVGEAFVIFFASVAVAAVFSFVIYEALKASTSALAARILFIFFSSLILYALLLAGTFYSVRVRHGSTPTAIGLKLDGLGKGFAWGLGLGVPLFAAALGVAYVSQQIVGPTKTDYVSQSMDRLASSGVSGLLVFLLIFTLVVLAPVCEEIFFRGYLYPALRNRMSVQPAMVLNGLLFAAAHFEIVGFLPRMLLGYGLCYMYERNHSLTGPMVGHALYNGLLILLFGVFSIF